MGEYEDFDLDRSTADAWDDFTDRLDDVVSMIDDGGELTIGTLSTSNDPAPFVRFRATGEASHRTLLCEAASNASLGDGFQLTLEQIEHLVALGWEEPSAVGPASSGNFHCRVAQEKSHDAAELAVATLRDVYGVQHPVFLAPDQLAEVLQPGPEKPGPGDILEEHDVVATRPRHRKHLDDMVTTELTHMFGHAPIRDTEGDIAIRVGSSVVFVRSTPDADELILFSVLVHDVEGRSRAVEVLNDLNVESRFGRFALHRDKVFCSMSVLADPFVPAHLHYAVRIMSQIADGIDDDLAAKLRGRTTFEVE